MSMTFTGLPGLGLAWIAPEPAFLQRASHALVHDGRVWLVDPVDGPGVRERIADLGRPAAVLRLLDRHGRDGEAMARDLDVPLVRADLGAAPGGPFVPVRVARGRRWHETALWWDGPRALVVAEALGTAPYNLAPGRRVGVHPLMRLTPPRALAAHSPRHLLVGHGSPLSGPEVADEVRRAIAGGRREAPAWLVGRARALVRRRLAGVGSSA